MIDISPPIVNAPTSPNRRLPSFSFSGNRLAQSKSFESQRRGVCTYWGRRRATASLIVAQSTDRTTQTVRDRLERPDRDVFVGSFDPVKVWLADPDPWGKFHDLSAMVTTARYLEACELLPISQDLAQRLRAGTLEDPRAAIAEFNSLAHAWRFPNHDGYELDYRFAENLDTLLMELEDVVNEGHPEHHRR